MLEVRLLGKFEVSRDGKPISITSRPAQSLFAYLILNAGNSHRREKLAGMLWPDSLEETARDNLRHALWRLRKALEAASSTRFLQADDQSITFKKSPDYRLDASELENVSGSASADELKKVLVSYQGELLPGFYEEWVLLQREHLSSIFEHHMARLLSLLQDEHRWLDVLEWGERWIRLGQKPEPAYQALMRAHAAKGDMSKVAATYERCVQALQPFGIEPSEQTRSLYETLKAGKVTRATIPPHSVEERRIDAPRRNLPVALTSFVGRKKEIDQIVKLLEKRRLVSLTGPGGVGKTRLAIQASQRLSVKFREGLWWVDLAGLKDGSLIVQAVAQAADVRELSKAPLLQTLAESIGKKHALLILDNCEHLVKDCAELAERLLSACGNLKILATSREILGLTGEEVWRVPPLSLPGPEDISRLEAFVQSESVALFVERALAVNPGFRVTERNAPSVAEICRRLDGMPLAVELAAARVKLLPVGQIAARLHNRFELLTSGSRTALPRHQTLQAAMDWSYDLLPDKERSLLCRLAVFTGGWTLEAAQAVCSGDGVEANEILDLLTYLVDKSLVILHRLEGGARFQMLETIREYALKKLPEVPQARDRHLAFYAQLVEEIEPKLHGAEQTLWLHRLEPDHDNIRAALDWSLAGGALETGVRLAGALWLFWDIHGYHLDGRVWLDRLLAEYQGPVRPPTTRAWARILYAAGHLRQRQGDFMQARRQYTDSLSIYRQLDDKKQVAAVLRGLGEIAQDEGDQVAAKSYYEQSLDLCRASGDARGMSVVLGHLAILVLLEKDYDGAERLCYEALLITRERENNRATAILLTTLGFASLGQGKLELATMQFCESLALQAELTDQRVAQYVLMGLALVALGRNQPVRAACLSGAADRQRERIGTPLPPSQRRQYEEMLDSIHAQLDETTFHASWAEGQAMTLERALAFALEGA